MILFNNYEVPFGHFPNGEINIPKAFLANAKEPLDSPRPNVVTLKYEGDEDLFRLFLVRKSLWFPCDLRITYFPYSRMDRNSDSYVFTLKSVAKFINLMEWNQVTVYEPHSDVTPALLNHCKIQEVVPYLKSLIRGYDYQVFFPDAGAQKRYEHLGSENALVGFKKRDFESGRIKELQILGQREKDTVVILDDLCSKGGTFVLAAEKLKEMGFTNIFLVVAHCEKTIFEGKVFSSGLIDRVITTDSILDIRNNYNQKLHIVPLTSVR